METILQVTLPAALSAVITWFISRRKNNEEIKQLQAENNKTSIENFNIALKTWENIVGSLEGQIEKLLNQKKQDDQEKEVLTQQVKSLVKLRYENSNEINELKCEVEKLRKEIQKFQGYAKENVELKKKIKDYEKNMGVNFPV